MKKLIQSFAITLFGVLLFAGAFYITKPAATPNKESNYENLNISEEKKKNNKEKQNKEENENEYDIEETYKIMYSTVSLNIRKLPNANSEQIGMYNLSDEIIVTGIVNNNDNNDNDDIWYRVEYKKGNDESNIIEGFVNSKYVSEETQL